MAEFFLEMATIPLYYYAMKCVQLRLEYSELVTTRSWYQVGVNM